jgi:cytochrome P450
VRVAPNDLSFATVASYKDIYGHTNKDRRTFVKSDFYQRKDQAPSIATERDVEKHAAVRRSLSYAFSPKALRDQTAVVVQYIDLFIQRLGEHAVDEPVNIVEWYNWLTFDIIGDLSFGKSFDALYNGNSIPTVW